MGTASVRHRAAVTRVRGGPRSTSGFARLFALLCPSRRRHRSCFALAQKERPVMQPQLSETFSFVQHVDPKSAIYCHSGSSLMPGCSCDEAVAAVRRLDATTALPSTAPGKPLVAQGKIGGTNPWTGEALPEVNVSSIRDVHKAVDAARTAQRFWKDLSLKQRARF